MIVSTINVNRKGRRRHAEPAGSLVATLVRYMNPSSETALRMASKPSISSSKAR